jgi:CelD/BcsL family acetyltransferase involved in cellulose biosynthesis
MATSTTATELRIDEIRNNSALAALREEWVDLHTRCHDATPFQRPEWLLPWWDQFHQGEMFVITIRAEKRLITLAPWFIQHQPNGARHLLFIGTPNTDYHDILVDPDFESEALAALADHLGNQQTRWDICDFQELTNSSAVLQMPCPTDCSTWTASGKTCTFLEIGATTDLSGILPHHICRNLRHAQHRAERLGVVEYDLANASNLEDSLAALFELHRARWAAEGEPGGVLKEQELWPFHREVARGFVRSGILRFHVMKLNGKIIACIYILQNRRRAFAYLSGFDPQHLKLSPGAMILGHAIQYAAEQSVKEFDFLRGREDYKLLWGVKERMNYRRTISK